MEEQIPNSVHLQDFPTFDKGLIHEDLSKSMNIVQSIVTAWLARRAKKKIRVRQPLQSITIWINLNDEFKEIIKDELNIKEVKTDLSINNKVKKIAKPDWKILWKKYWKDFKTILNLAKNWEFEELEDWKIKVWNWILEKNEFEFDYINNDQNLDIEVYNWIVISIDPTITEELENEWFVRDLIRIIQESRKEAWYNLDDRIKLEIIDENWFTNKFKDYIENETLSKIEELKSCDLQKEIDLGKYKVTIKLKK